jgi:diguanylate cyclase (GGDEF)-like protein/PAS domain S-box-containing protein
VEFSRRLLAATAAATVAWTASVWFASDRFHQAEARAAIAAEAKKAEHDATAIADGIERTLAMRRGIAITLAADETVRRAAIGHMQSKRVRSAAPQATPEMRDLNRFLRAAEEHLKLDALWVGDADGIGFAAQSADPGHSPIGVDYSDRIYYRQARAGRVGYQYAVGRTTGIGGIFFSGPIMDGQRFLGFVLAKTNVTRLAPWLGQGRVLVADAAGVVVLASEPGMEMRALPGSAVDRLSNEERRNQYARIEIAPLDIADWPDARFAGLKRVDGIAAPVVLHAQTIPDFGLTVTVLRPLEEITAIDRRGRLAFLSGAGIGILVLAMLAMWAANRRQRRQAEDRLRLAATVFENADEGICVTDADQRVVDVNPTLCRLTGYSRETLLGETPRLFQSGRQDGAFYQAMWQAINRDDHWRGELWNRHRNGDHYAVRLTVSAVRDHGGRVKNYIGIMANITATKQQFARLEHVAHFDALTGLPNRLLLADRMHQSIARTHRGDTFLAVCYLDLDGFKPINDRLGHEAGDRVLAEVARRLDGCLRGGDTVARLGGDEFVLLLSGLQRHDEYEVTLNRVLDEIRSPLTIDGHEFGISASIGVVLCPRDGKDQDELLRMADQAMYAAKQAGRNRWHVFVPGETLAAGHESASAGKGLGSGSDTQ